MITAMILFFIMAAAGWTVGYVCAATYRYNEHYEKGFEKGYKQAQRDIRSRQY